MIVFVPGHFAERHFADGHFAEKTFCRTDNLPKIEMLFRQNIKHPRSPMHGNLSNCLGRLLNCHVNESLAVYNHIDSLFVQRMTHLLGTCFDARSQKKRIKRQRRKQISFRE
jgi:hypothetical protein